MSQITLSFDQSRGTINPNIYGHFSEHIGGVFYDGLWVGEDSPVPNIRGWRKAAVEAFAKLQPPVLRWPGGCFAETYDWRDGIGPRESRPTRINWWYRNDGRTESNAVGTHEFIDFCRLVGAQPYFAANVTSVTPLHIRDWVEYCNFPGGTTLSDERAANGNPEPFNIQYWGIGNENWGDGGKMTPEYYAREYCRFATTALSACRTTMYPIICGANGHDTDWTRRLMQEWKKNPAPIYGMSVHYYCGQSGDPVAFDEGNWYQLLQQADFMRRIVDDHRAALDESDPERKIPLIVDEWGCWHPEGSGPSKGYNLFEQQSTMRDAVVAALTLNLFNNRCDVVAMSNIAQLCNNLHALFLAGGEQFICTPTYHVYDLYCGHKGGRQVETTACCEKRGELDMVSVSASEKADGTVTITAANLSYDKADELRFESIGKVLSGKANVRVLSGDVPQAHNTFEDPNRVGISEYEVEFTPDTAITLPAASVISITITPEN